MRLLVVVTVVAAASCTSTPAGQKRYDLSTAEARSAAVREAAGIDEARSKGCVSDADDFSNVVLVGSRGGYDQGCVAAGYFADGVYVTAREDARAALGDAWTHPSKREAVARMWLRGAFEISLVDSAGSVALVAGRDSAGGLVFDGWDEGSLTSAGCFRHLRVTVAPDARFSFRTLDGFRGPGCY